MSGYEPFLIGYESHGLEEGLQPWLLPQDAWAVLLNAYLRRGVLNKRNGYSSYARMVHAVDDEAIGLLGDTHYTGTLVNGPIRAGDLSFTDGTLTITDDGDGTLSGDGSGTINYTTRVYDITFSGITTGAVIADYDFYPELPVVGIENYWITSGDIDLMIFDTKRCAKWDALNSKLEDTTSATDIWTGTAANLIWGCNSRGRLYVTNNNDRIKYWNGTIWTDYDIDIDGDVANDVSVCLLIFNYKERIVILRPTESGTLYPNRARWCEPADHDDWTNDGYVDCPTKDWIMTADFIGEDLIVFFTNSTWRLRYTADASLPFRWEQIDLSLGSYGSFSGFSYSDVMAVISETNIVETDNLKVYNIDDKIPDAVGQIDASLFNLIYSIPVQQLEQVLISYPSIDSTTNDLSLCYNYKDKSWSRYDYSFNVYGHYKEGSTGLTWDEIEETWDELEYTWDDVTRQAGYPIVLGGDNDGYVWKINYGSSDNGNAILFNAKSGRWNPYLKQGLKARFGWVDFLVDRDPTISLTVNFYVDRSPSLHSTATIVFGEADDDSEKVWVRAYNGAIGDFHRMELTNNASGQTPRIHAMMLYMKPAGKRR